MLEFVSKLFATNDFPAQWHSAGGWVGHGWLHLVCGFTTFGACLAIAGVFVYLAIRRRDLPFPRIVGLFCAFVIAYGTVQLMEAVVFWWPAFGVYAVVKVAAAVISWVTVVAVVCVVPRALEMRAGNGAERASRRLASVVESLEDAVISTSAEGVIASWDGGAERMLQYTAAEAIGQDVSILAPRAKEDESQQRLPAIASGGRLDAIETVLCGKDGKEFDASRVVSAMGDRDGERDGAPIVVRDITQRKRVEASWKQKAERLCESQKLEAVGALAGGVAHEFNNLLQAIQGYTQYAMEGLSSEERRYRDLQQVLEASDRAASLVRQLLNFGRRHKIDRTQFDVNALVADTEAMLRPLLGEHIDLRIDLCPGEAVVEGDGGLLQETLSHLCVNARDAMPKGGRLCIRTEQVLLNEAYCQAHVGVKPGDYAVLTVADTGQGISKEVSGHLFEPFFTTKEVGKGTGLGLAMVYGVVQQHGGVIHVYSEPGQGATFKIYLPLVAAQQEAREAVVAATHEGSETVLVAEDEPMVRDLVARILRGAGYSVLEVSNGAEALDVLQSKGKEVSLALLDVVMPQVSGRAVYERIKGVRPQTKVVFCTGYDPETGQASFASEEGLRLIQKPVDPDELLRTIREVLDDNEPCHMMQATS